jgi:hypothetical protein
MKQNHFLFSLFIVFIFCNTLVAQRELQNSDEFFPRWSSKTNNASPIQPTQELWNPAITKRPGHYTINDWRNFIDSIWGPGISTTEKLKIFDDYWNLVDQTWGGFPNISINWDSLKNVYRPEVAAGVSRGRFYGILSRMSRALNEMHTIIFDMGIDGTQGIYWVGANAYPNHPLFNYKPGIPIFITPVYHRTNFGAGVTPLPDSTALVYSVIPNHPLNLEQGDIILGYDGIPWKNLIRDLYEAELPILGGGLIVGSSPHSAFHIAMLSVGMNWGLFDTIDVFKYSTKETLHFPTSLLKTIVQPYHVATEQLPIKGVSFPEFDANKLVSWGIVEGTTIGYIYVLDWWGKPIGETRILFGQAVKELLNKNISGLILDFRTNYGGWPDYANEGFKLLFNFDPTSYYSQAIRIVGNDHNAFNILPPVSAQIFTPGGVIFDRPIAVLVGPNCISSGDYNAFRMRFHPMVRFFGKKTSGAYVAWSNSHEGNWNQDYHYAIYDGSVYSNFNNEGFMIHKSFEVDEEVWLTQSGVAKGEDDVVKSALQWINTVAYSHSVVYSKSQLNSNGDSCTITALVKNPLNHSLAVTAAIKTLSDSSMIDSISLFNDGLHNDGLAGDSIWSGSFLTKAGESNYFSIVTTKDITAGTYRSLPIKSPGITSAGPIVCIGDSVTTTPVWGTSKFIKFKIRNDGKSATINGVTARLRSLDTLGVITSLDVVTIGNISPGQVRLSNSLVIKFSQWGSGKKDIPFEITFSASNVEYWKDTVFVSVDDPTGVAENEEIPRIFSLSQNYPNPFNPTTVISYQLPVNSNVTLRIFDLLGREVVTLVNEEQSAGWKEVEFQSAVGGGQLASGIYFYKLQANNFIETKKMLVIK